MSQAPTPTSSAKRLTIAVRGVVQGVGFRPFVYNSARSLGLGGWVQNEAGLVRIEVEGDPLRLDAFLTSLRERHPPQARIDSLEVEEGPSGDGALGAFRIVASSGQSPPRPAIPADLATCPECLKEVLTPGERRFRYPFTNCTCCGPRWSIIRGLPYDRARTSMAQFPMCPACLAEYEDPADRRFHAQPIACPRCGPALRLMDSLGRAIGEGDDPIEAAAGAVRGGKIVALKGLGGFQLVCDATSDEAVMRLRTRKRRPDKPLAVMFGSLDKALRYCAVSDEEAGALSSHQVPILLVRRRSPCAPTASSLPSALRPLPSQIAPSVAPGNPYLGVMLPYTPLHHLLMEAIGRPVVCTSGNLSEEPMATRTAEALERLGSIADAILTHNRPIVRPVDDSVARVLPSPRSARAFDPADTADRRSPLPARSTGSFLFSPVLQVLRRARGYAPLPIDLGFEAPTILAVGGHLKNAVALSIGSQAVVGQHVGDLDNLAGVEVHRRAVRDLVDFFRVTPEAVACDLHPDYASTRHAEELAAAWDVPLVRVQHHHAHVTACLAEQGFSGADLEGPVLGFSWDGTGYGPDGTVWGGEALWCEGADFRRVAHLRTFRLPGGDRAVREPRRSALGLLYETLGEEATEIAAPWFKPGELAALMSMLRRSVHSPRTSSVGRLFDAVAALCGMAPVISFEGQAAMALEFAAEQEGSFERGVEPYPLPVTGGVETSVAFRSAKEAGFRGAKGDNAADGGPPSPPTHLPKGDGREEPAVLDWEPLVRAVLADRTAGVPAGRISLRFHHALAAGCAAAAERSGAGRVALSGGCFQNALLQRLAHARLCAAGFHVLLHHHVPPGDGGIALGQILVAARHLEGRDLAAGGASRRRDKGSVVRADG